MKKSKRRTRLWSALLTLMIVGLSALPVMAEAGVAIELQSTENDVLSGQGRTHGYDVGITDGGVYNLKNVYHNTYMDVDGANPANTTEVSTYPKNGITGTLNQQFKFFYLGKGVYEIVAMHSGTNLHINSQGALIIYAKNRSMEQRYKVQMLNSTTGVIFTQFSGYSQALCFDVNDPNSVVQKTYSTLSDKTQAQWVFEKVNNSSGDWYNTYYVRHHATGMYMDVHTEAVSSGSVVLAFQYLGQANQEWIVRYDSATSSYTFTPGHRRDMALDYTDTHVAIRNEGNAVAQSFRLIDSGQRDAQGRVKYQIQIVGSAGNGYLNIGVQPDYSTAHYYVDKGSNNADYWVLEEVPIDGKDPVNLGMNNWHTETITAGYGETKWYTFTSYKDSRYKIELMGDNVVIGTIVSAASVTERVRYPYQHLDIVDVFFSGHILSGNLNDIPDAELSEKKEIFYIPVTFDGTPGGSSTTFSIRVRQLSFVGHSNGTNMAADINAINDSVQYTMNCNFEHRQGITASVAKASTDSLTGNSDFNAEIFVYSGHGTGGLAAYEGVPNQELYSSHLPNDMSNCELVVWDCCLSALGGSYNGVYYSSLTAASIERGAKTAIGWNTQTCTGFTRVYMNYLFEELATGKSTGDANEDAKAKVQATYAHSTNCNCGLPYTTNYFVNATKIYGDLSHVIFSTNGTVNAQVIENATGTAESGNFLIEETAGKINGLLESYNNDMKIDIKLVDFGNFQKTRSTDFGGDSQ